MVYSPDAVALRRDDAEVDGDVLDLADGAGLQLLHHAAHGGEEARPDRLHEEGITLSGQSHKVLGLTDIDAQRLLTEDCPACVQQLLHQLVVGRVDGAHVPHV